MSGARALASARRRRAAPDERRQPSNIPQNKQSSQPSPPHPPQNNEEVKVPQNINNPMVMLLNHNKILDNLQNVVTSLNDKVESYDNYISNKIENLVLDETNIEFFKQKVTNIEKELTTIKKHILKVQTFAMETNLQCIEMKKKLENNTLSVEEEQEQTNEITELLLTSENNDLTG